MTSHPSHSSHSPVLPAGGMPSSPHDPQTAFGTPGQGEQNKNAQRDDIRSTAFDFGWQSRLQYGSPAATKNVSFETIEAELEKQWGQLQSAKSQKLPWQEARAIAKDAWNQVYDALTESPRAAGQ